MRLPCCLSSFGYNSNVPSLMKHYGKNPKQIRTCLLIGTGVALFLYIVWLVDTMGNISQPDFKPIVNQGSNIDVLISAISGILNIGGKTKYPPNKVGILFIFTVAKPLFLICVFLVR